MLQTPARLYFVARVQWPREHFKYDFELQRYEILRPNTARKSSLNVATHGFIAQIDSESLHPRKLLKKILPPPPTAPRTTQIPPPPAILAATPPLAVLANAAAPAILAVAPHLAMLANAAAPAILCRCFAVCRAGKCHRPRSLARNLLQGLVSTGIISNMMSLRGSYIWYCSGIRSGKLSPAVAR
jgi:hypothetical protein